MFQLSKLFSSEKMRTCSDDLRIIRNWVEYSPDNRTMKYLMYEMEMEEPNGQIVHMYKALKMIRIIRLPKSAKQSEAFMSMHSQILGGVWSQNINFFTLIANIMYPKAIGLVFCYGVQGISTTEDGAKEKADFDFAALQAALQGTYRTLQFRILNYEELEWIREKLFTMNNIVVVRGIPKAKDGGVDAGTAGVGGENINPDSEDTTEEFVAGMVDHEYIIQILSTPVKKEHLERWLERSSKEMTKWNKQLQGTSAVNFGLSIPMMYMANLGASEGWSHSYTDATSVSTSAGSSFNTTYGVNSSEGVSDSFSESVGKTIGTSITDSYSQSHSISTGESHSVSNGVTSSESWGESTSVGSTFSHGISVSENIGTSNTSSVSDGTSSSSSLSHSDSHGISASQSESLGTSQGTSHTDSVSDGTSLTNSTSHTTSHTDGTSSTFGGSTTTTNGTSYTVTDGYSDGTTNSQSYGENNSHSTGISSSNSSGTSWSSSSNNSHTNGTSSSSSASGLGQQFAQGEDGFGSDLLANLAGANINYTNGTGSSDSTTTGSGTSEGGSSSLSEGTSSSDSFGSSSSWSNSVSHTDNHSVSVGESSSVSNGTSWSEGVSSSDGYSDSTSTSIGSSHSVSSSDGFSSSVSHTLSLSNGTTDSYSDGYGSSQGVTHSDTLSEGATWGQSSGTNDTESQSYTSGTSHSTSVGTTYTEGYGTSSGESWGDTQSTSYGESESDSYTQSVSNGTNKSWGKSESVSSGTSYGESVSQSLGQSLGITGATTSGTTSTMGLGPSISYSKSYQWMDQEVKNILTLLEFQNQRLMKALRGNGAFFTDVYIGTMDEESRASASILARTAWNNTEALTCPLQVMDLDRAEQTHLLYHFAAFSADNAKENLSGAMESYRYSTILLPDEFTAYTHLPRISEGGVYADVEDVPKFSVPSGLTGDIYIGSILSAERYSYTNGYETPFSYRLDESELMHAVITGESRSGKTVAATRFISEATKIRRKKTGKRLRIVALDPKQDWRILGKFVEPSRFHFYSLGNPDFLPINLNICKVPHNVNPQTWVDGIIEIYCRNYGLMERGKSILGETFFELYDEAGVFEDSPNWRDFVPERSKKVTLCKVYERLLKHKLELEDPAKSGKGRAGNEVRDCYNRLTDRMQVFGRKFSIETRLFGQEDGIGIDELIGKDDIIVLESYGLESTFKNFIFGCITSGFFKYAQGHEKGFLADDQYETLMVIEEANEVLCGSDTAGGAAQMTFAGQSEFEKILDQAAGLGLFIFSITQKIADMPSSVVANSGIIFAGKISRAEDTQVVIRKIGREERIDNRDVLKWFPRSPIGWFVCRSSRNFNFLQVEPVLVHVAPLHVSPPTNDQLIDLIHRKKAMKTMEDDIEED